MQIHPLTKIASDYQEKFVKSVAVNEEFITYGLKQGHIRVLHRFSEARALLKGHSGPIASICFLTNNIVAAGGMDGRLHVWKVNATEDENALHVETILEAGFSPGCETSNVLVAPCDGEGKTMAVGVGNSVILLDIPSTPAEGLDLDPLDPSPNGRRMDTFPMQDAPKSLSISNKMKLAIGSKRGRVYLVNIDCEQDAKFAGPVQTLDVGREVNSVHWLSASKNTSALLVSTDNGRNLALYSEVESSMSRVDEIGFEEGKDGKIFMHVSCLPEQNIAVLADTPGKCIYVLHMNAKVDNEAQFDKLAKFSVGKPVLSLDAFWSIETSDEERCGLEVNCIQTDAVQQYYIDIDEFRQELPHSPSEILPEMAETKDSSVSMPVEESDKVLARTVIEIPNGEQESSIHGKLLTPSDIISGAPESESETEEHPVEDIQAEVNANQEEEEAKGYISPVVEREEAGKEKLSSVPLDVLEACSLGDLFNLLKKEMDRHAAKQSKLLEKSMKETRKHLDDQLSKISKAFDKKLSVQVKSEMKALQPQIAVAVQSAAKESIRTVLPKEAMGAIKSSLDKQLSSAVQGALAKTIQESFRHSFSKQIVPAFDSACQSMLHQLDVTVANGLMEQSQNIGRSLKEPINLTSALQSSLDSARMLVDNLGSQGQTVSRTLSNSTIGSYRSPRSQDHKSEIKSLVASGRYEEAFGKALSLQDLSIVSWICSNVDAATVLSSTNSLSQMVLLSLLQQLAADLSGNTATKLQWVREAAMTINPTDHTIAAHIKPVLEHVLSSLQTILPSLQPEDASSCKLALHVVRSQLST